MTRLPMKRGYEAGLVFSAEDHGHYVKLWRQPYHRWLISRAYHLYDTFCFRLPGFSHLERWHRRRNGGDDMFIPLGCLQDIRCFDLAHKDREILATFDIDDATFERIQRYQEVTMNRWQECPDPEPHGSHEWYDPALRQNCPGRCEHGISQLDLCPDCEPGE